MQVIVFSHKFRMVRFFDIPWDVNDHHAFYSAKKEKGFYHSRALIMQNVVIPAPLDQFRNNNSNQAVRVLTLNLKDKLPESDGQ